MKRKLWLKSLFDQNPSQVSNDVPVISISREKKLLTSNVPELIHPMLFFGLLCWWVLDYTYVEAWEFRVLTSKIVICTFFLCGSLVPFVLTIVQVDGIWCTMALFFLLIDGNWVFNIFIGCVNRASTCLVQRAVGGFCQGI